MAKKIASKTNSTKKKLKKSASQQQTVKSAPTKSAPTKSAPTKSAPTSGASKRGKAKEVAQEASAKLSQPDKAGKKSQTLKSQTQNRLQDQPPAESPKQKREKVKEEKGKKDKGAKKQKRTLADKADKFSCYQKSVQCPEHDVDFFEQAYRDVHHRKPGSLREDFCGTFAVCCDWVTRGRDRTAVGVDLCPETLQWGREHNLSKLKPEQQARIRLLEQDVREKNLPSVDVLAAQNFSFWIFQSRPEVITYLRAARENLKPGGIIVLDMMGGSDCYREGNEDKKVIGKGKKKFHYFWKQVSFNPVNNNARFAISFRFRDGSKLENAFEYDWRFWTIPEVREMLKEAGFSSSRVYFENEEDDSIWEAREHAPSHSVWLAYIVAVR